MLQKVNSIAADAVISFLNKHNPAQSRENPKITPHLETILKGGNLVFMYNGRFVHEDAAICRAWEAYKSNSDAVLAQCLITGEITPIARLHPSIKGVRNANPIGASLVSFDERAYESFNKVKGQGLNSPVSEKATFAYTTALNYIPSSTKEHKKFAIGDTTVIYWAESEKKGYARVFLSLCEPEEVEIPTEPEPQLDGIKTPKKRFRKVAAKVRRVQALDVTKLLEGLDGNPRFYVLNIMAPNAARVSVRFFHSDPFDRVVGEKSCNTIKTWR